MEQRFYDLHVVVNHKGKNVADDPMILTEAQATEFLRLWQSYFPSMLELTIRPIKNYGKIMPPHDNG
jgi:hypothetical protein